MKTFLVEMDDVGYGCEISNGVMCTHYNTKKHCKGDLNNRPAFCPLREVKELEVDDLCYDAIIDLMEAENELQNAK